MKRVGQLAWSDAKELLNGAAIARFNLSPSRWVGQNMKVSKRSCESETRTNRR